MALPKINNAPKYSMKIPSTGKTVTYRPFLVKEQKILLMALESRDNKQILQSIIDTIDSCVYDNINTNTLTTFDLEYMFLQLRSKSVGEVSTIKIVCDGCSFDNPTDVMLNDVAVDMSKAASNKIRLNDQYTLVLKYPSFNDVTKLEDKVTSESAATGLIAIIISSLDKLLTDDEVISFDEETYESKSDFIDQLNNEQFAEVTKFIDNIPTLTHTVEFDCAACKKHNTYKLQGLQDFF